MRFREWGKLLTITGGGQVIVQATGVVSGILITRLLSTYQYALYTLVNTMLGSMIVLADGGIAAGVMAEGGKVWQDRKKLGIVLSTGLFLRKKFAFISILVATPILFCLLLRHGASWLTSIIIILSLIPAFYAAVSDSLLEVAPKLKQDIIPLQKNQIIANLGRLVLTSLTLIIFPIASAAIVSGGLPRMWANIRLKGISSTYADWSQNPDPAIQHRILSFVKRILPGAIYYSFAGQITIWLVSIFGSTTAVAQVGALGRLTMVLSLFSGLFSTLIVPRFAKLPINKNLLITRFLQVQFGLFFILALFISPVFIFPNQVLAVLGGNYKGLDTEIILMTIGSCISLISGATYSISLSRGWILPPVIHILGNIIIQTTLICVLNLKTTQNVIIFSIISSALAFAMVLAYFIFNVLKLKANE